MSSVSKPAPSEVSSLSPEVSRPSTPDPVVTTFTDEHIVRSQDGTHHRERMRELKNRGHAGWSPTREMKLAYEIPVLFIEKWSLEDGVNYHQLDKREFVKRVEAKIQKYDLTDFKLDGSPQFRTFLSS